MEVEVGCPRDRSQCTPGLVWRRARALSVLSTSRFAAFSTEGKNSFNVHPSLESNVRAIISVRALRMSDTLLYARGSPQNLPECVS